MKRFLNYCSSRGNEALISSIFQHSGFDVRCSMFDVGSAKSQFRIGVRCFFLFLAIILTTVLAQAQPLTIRSLAGNTTPGSTNGPGPTARFDHPVGLAIDLSGN